MIVVKSNSKIEKTEEGIFIDGKLEILKSFLVYLIQYMDKLDKKEKAELIYNNKSARHLIANYIVKMYGALDTF